MGFESSTEPADDADDAMPDAAHADDVSSARREHAPPRSNLHRARLATRRWTLAGLTGLAAAMLCSFTGALDVFPAPIESLVVFIGGGAVFGLLAPRRLMRELERDDAPTLALLAERACAVADGDRRIALGDLALSRDDDLGRLSRALHDLAAEARANKHHARLMSRRIGHHVQRETSRATASLQKEAMSDPLTGLGNRRALQWHIDRLIATDGAGAVVTVLLADMDRFKQINDTLGHSEGDRCLKFLADVIKSCLRNRDVVIRLGGDEFLALMPGAGAENARNAAQRLQGMFQQMPWSHAAPRPTLSIGLASGGLGDLRESGSLLERADAALYAAKRQGRARVAVFAEATRAA